MARKKDRSPEELVRREKIRELLQLANVGSMDDIHELFKETIGEFMENGLEAELGEELGYGTYVAPNRLLIAANYRKEYAKHFATTVGLVYDGMNSGMPIWMVLGLVSTLLLLRKKTCVIIFIIRIILF